MQLTLNTCVIRSLEISDAESLAHHANDHEIWLHLRDTFPHPYSIEDAHSYLNLVSQDEDPLSFAIDVDGSAIGGIAAHRQSDVHRFCVEIGYWIGREHWGKGIASEAVRFFSDFLLNEKGFHRVFAVPFADNSASERVLEKAGFTLEGISRASAFKNGKILDQKMYARISTRT